MWEAETWNECGAVWVDRGEAMAIAPELSNHSCIKGEMSMVDALKIFLKGYLRISSYDEPIRGI